MMRRILPVLLNRSLSARDGLLEAVAVIDICSHSIECGGMTFHETRSVEVVGGASLTRRSSLTSYSGASPIRNCFLLGPYNRPMPRAIWWS